MANGGMRSTCSYSAATSCTWWSSSTTAGVLGGDDHTWRRDGRRAEQSPLKLARRNAQYLRSLLDEEYERAGGRLLGHPGPAGGRRRGLAGVGRVPPGQPGPAGAHPLPGPRPRIESGGAASLRNLAEHEYTVLRRLRHDAVMQPDDFVESELGIGLAYPYEEGWQRLDLWLAAQPQAIALETALSILRQVAEAVQYATGTRWCIGGSRRKASWVHSGGGHDLAVQVRGWQGAAGVDRVRVDVFGPGALAFYLVAAQPAARSVGALRTRLRLPIAAKV